MPGRMRPSGVGEAGTQATAGSAASSALGSAWPSASRTRRATADLSRSTITLGAMAATSSEKRLATQPQATTTGACGSVAAWRTALRVLASASPVTAQVLMTIASASDSLVRRAPARSSSDAITSASTRFTLQPRLTTLTLAPLTWSRWRSCARGA